MKKFLIYAALASTVFLSACGEKGTGEKNGTVTKLSQVGVLCKTWEAEIVRGGLTNGTGVMGKSFDFTVEDKDLLAKVKQAFEQQREVRIHYRTEINSFCRSESDNNFLTAIEFVGPGQGSVVRDDPQSLAPVTAPAGITTNQFERLLDQNQQALDQNNRLLIALEKKLN